MRTILHQEMISRLQICQRSSSSAELSTNDEMHTSGSNEMCFANSEERRCDHCLFDKRRYEKEYTWLYYNFNKKVYSRDQQLEKKSSSNELYVEKPVKIVHFLACNNLSVKELYPKMIKFLSDEINEPVIKQYLETCPKNTAYDSSNSCDSIIVPLNSHLKEKSISTIVNVAGLVFFADEATSAARKEMRDYFKCI